MTMLPFSLLHLLLIAVSSSFLPAWTRPDLFFAVTVPADFRQRDEGRAIVRRYRLLGWAGTVLLTIGAVWLGDRAAAFAAAVGGGVAVWMAAFFAARRETLPHAVAPDPIRTATLAVRRDGVPGGVIGLAAPMVILAARGLECYFRWDEIPARFPIHWGLSGPDRWAERTPAALLASFASIGLFCAVMLFFAWAMVHRSRQIAAPGGQESSERRFRRIGVAGLMVFAWIFALALPPIENMRLVIPFGPGLILVAALGWMVALVLSGQGGTRLPSYQSIENAGAAPAGDRTPDGSWKLGMFYVNRGDPALIVEKRFGIGWTLNFGNPMSWLVVAALVSGPLLLQLVR